MHVIKRLMANYDTPRQCLNFVGTDFDVRPCSASLNINVNMNNYCCFLWLGDGPVSSSRCHSVLDTDTQTINTCIVLFNI